jgi:uncharacterized protein YegP (UPF0339 family)
MHFELYKDCCPMTKERWRWRLLSGDGTVVALSSNGYGTEDECRLAVIDLKKISPNTPIETRRSLRPPFQSMRARHM